MLEEPSKILSLSYPRPLPHLPSSPRPSHTNLVGTYGILHHFCAGELVVDVAWIRFKFKLDALTAAFDGLISSSEAKTTPGVLVLDDAEAYPESTVGDSSGSSRSASEDRLSCCGRGFGVFRF